MYQTYNPYYNPNYINSSYYNQNPQDERFVGGFLGPFLLGGLAGGLVAGGFNRPPYTFNNFYYPPYPYYPYPYRPYCC